MSATRSRSLQRLAGDLRSGELTASGIMEEALERHARFGDALKAYHRLDPERARHTAGQVDVTLSSGRSAGALAGVPVSAKDLYGVSGYPTFAGTARALPERWEQEGFLVGRLRKLGAVFSGKTHTVELAFGAVGTNPHWGTPMNPWGSGPVRVPGGSSCGAGVSLWEGSALVALGTDTGGSIRIPASATGTVGHKSTHGRWGTDGVVPLSIHLDTVGALTRTVADAVYFFGAIEGGSPDDLIRDLSGWAPSNLRIGIPKTTLWEECQEDIRSVVLRALGELEAGGATLVDVDGPPLDQAYRTYMEVGTVAAECTAFLNAELPDWWSILHPTVRRRIAKGEGLSAPEYLQALRERDDARTVARESFAGIDVLATPTLPITPPTVDELADVERYLEANGRMLRATSPISLLDLCALSMPVGLDGAGMPVGLQLVAPGGQDETLLGAALGVERTLGTATERMGRPPRLVP